MSKAQHLLERLDSLLQGSAVSESVVYTFRPFPGETTATPNTTNLKDMFRLKGFTEGQEYTWLSPLSVQIETAAIDKDVLDVLKISGGVEIPS